MRNRHHQIIGQIIGGALACLLGGVTLWSCGELEIVEGNACDRGADCIYPAVCCTNPRIPPVGARLPYCEDISYCDGFLPVLAEGNPCYPGSASPITSCSEPWICCEKSYTCQTAEACEQAPPFEYVDMGLPDDGGVSMPTPCTAHEDCPRGTLCFGITLNNRDNGTCVAPPMPTTTP